MNRDENTVINSGCGAERAHHMAFRGSIQTILEPAMTRSKLKVGKKKTWLYTIIRHDQITIKHDDSFSSNF